MDSASVILAVGSPPGQSRRGLVRASGPGVFDIFDRLAQEPVARSRGISSVRLGVQGLDLPALLIRCPGPASYTGEDVVELQLPGQPLLLERVIDAAVAAGAALGIPVRRAEAGEYTSRAWHSGRVSLTEAEGVAALIAARSDAELRAAGLLKSGRLGAVAIDSSDRIADMLALVEAGIDFTDEEDVVAIEPTELTRRLSIECEELQHLLDRAVGMDVLQAIPVVVLCGPTNAGKSTLFNALLSDQRAVVADVAGTTRDAIAEPLQIDSRGAEVLLVDVAGLQDESGTYIEQRMQSMARSFMEQADVLIHCLPSNVEASWLEGPHVMRVRTKHDLDPSCDDGDIRISAMHGTGMESIRTCIAERTSEQASHLAADALALQPRHDAAIREALTCLHDAAAVVAAAPGSSELIATHLRTSLDAMSILSGTIAPDDVLGRVFASFCIGK
ncbi:MAG: 50S ribosome-binding GTPase [Phycisphaerales bacterium]|nr:50S ribosome-binding GTPase [Phycisphaerales bacterium]